MELIPRRFRGGTSVRERPLWAEAMLLFGSCIVIRLGSQTRGYASLLPN